MDDDVGQICGKNAGHPSDGGRPPVIFEP